MHNIILEHAFQIIPLFPASIETTLASQLARAPVGQNSKSAS